MEDKQVELGAEETQQAVETTESQPSLEELKQSVDKKEAEIQRLQGILRKEQSRGVSKSELEAITKRIDSLQEWNAEIFDDLARKLDGDSFEEPRQGRKSYKQTLAEKRQAQSNTGSSPEVDAFFDYLADQGLALEDDIVKEALDPTEDRTPKQAMKFLKERMKTQQMSEVEKMVETKAEEKAKSLLEARFKEMGLTAGGVGAPSATSGRGFTRQQISDMSMSEYAENRDAIEKAEREGRIK